MGEKRYKNLRLSSLRTLHYDDLSFRSLRKFPTAQDQSGDRTAEDAEVAETSLMKTRLTPLRTLRLWGWRHYGFLRSNVPERAASIKIEALNTVG